MIPIKKLRVDKYFDIGCSVCCKQRSTDFEKGMDEISAKHLRIAAESEGWTVSEVTGLPVCPLCSKASNNAKNVN